VRKLVAILGLAALVAAGLGLWLTRAKTVDETQFADLTGDPEAGEQVFIAAGCASCHHAPESEEKLVLAGGQKFQTTFGTFVAPNISPDPEAGIGGWQLSDLANALRYGTSPEGQHYYPAFPYTAYTRLTDRQIADLWAYFQTLPPDPTPSQAHDLAFPYNIRRSLGGWKLLYLSDDWVMTDVSAAELERGRELVEALGHCGECHTPRDALGGLRTDAWLTGAPNPAGKGTIPALTPDELDWSAVDIAYYLETGFTPDFDSAGGHMVKVIENFAELSEADRAAVAAYLKALPD
jgi:mono/diheme cytochrome c family protein